MLFPLKELIEGRGKPLCVTKDTKVTDALALMMEHDYSQLPIVDEDGNLCGMISESAIMGMYYHTGGIVSLLDLDIGHFQTSPVTAAPGNDIFEALDLLQNNYAIVIIEDRKPVGILTNYDTTHFFRDVSEGLILVQDIEEALRQYIETVFFDDNRMCAALMRAFGASKRDTTQPAHTYDELSFGQHIQLIITDENWKKFEGAFKPKQMFIQLMDQVRDIRNQLAHFRGRLEPVQRDALLRARDWLASRPKLPVTVPLKTLEVKAQAKAIRVTSEQVTWPKGAGKYAPVEQWLLERKAEANIIRVTFEDIETLLDEPLPLSAREHRSWWANDSTSHTQSLAWMRAGWRVDDVDLTAEKVVFKQTVTVLNQLFFADLLKRLKQKRPGVTRATKTYPQNWWSFGAGRAGFSFVWAFTQENTLKAELYIDTGDKAENKAAFDKLYQQKADIEEAMGSPLTWERLNDKKASRVSLHWPNTNIKDPPDKLEQAKEWALKAMLKLIDTFQPRLKEL